MNIGAPINVSTIEFLAGINIPIMEVYRLSETTVAQCLASITKWHLSSVDQCIKGIHLKISSPDENSKGEVGDRFMYMSCFCQVCLCHRSVCMVVRCS